MDNRDKNGEESFNDNLDSIEKSGSIKADNVHCISIIGQIEGHYVLPTDQKSTKYEHIVPLLFAIERSEDIEGALIILNT